MWLLPAVAVVCLGSVQAAAKDQANIVRDYTDIVGPADQQAYEAGIKSYNQCLAEHGFKYAWTSWVHETGDVYSYSYVSDPMTWAGFDAMRDAGKACDTTFRTQVNPHLKSETSVFMQGDAELRHLFLREKIGRAGPTLQAFETADVRADVGARVAPWLRLWLTRRLALQAGVELGIPFAVYDLVVALLYLYAITR